AQARWLLYWRRLLTDDPIRNPSHPRAASHDLMPAQAPTQSLAMAAQTALFYCFKDNFGVLLHDPASGATAAIDAPEAAPVEAALAQAGWRLNDILVTHHHGDHTAGIEPLKERYGCRVIAPAREASRIPQVDVPVREGDSAGV